MDDTPIDADLSYIDQNTKVVFAGMDVTCLLYTSVILEILKWILRIILGALKLVLGLARIILLLFAMVARIFLSFVRMGTF